MDPSRIIEKGQRCIEIEIEALRATCDSLDARFARVAVILNATVERGGKIILSGVGKNAHICEKLVATLNSIGAPATFLDPVRALHGDLGLCRQGDILLAFSNSGETDEILRLATLVKRFDLTTVAVTARPDSALSELCDERLLYRADREACPLDLAPTASTCAAMAIGDALAMVLLEMRSFSREDFARFHPGGELGRTLAPRVDQIMRSGDRLATLPDTALGEQCLQLMSQLSSGCIALTGADGRLAGVLTDGDIRRFILARPGFLKAPISEVMTRSPISIRSGAFAAEALKVFERHRIDDLIVVDRDSRPIGVIDGQDLTKVRMV